MTSASCACAACTAKLCSPNLIVLTVALTRRAACCKIFSMLSLSTMARFESRRAYKMTRFFGSDRSRSYVILSAFDTCAVRIGFGVGFPVLAASTIFSWPSRDQMASRNPCAIGFDWNRWYTAPGTSALRKHRVVASFIMCRMAFGNRYAGCPGPPTAACSMKSFHADSDPASTDGCAMAARVTTTRSPVMPTARRRVSLRSRSRSDSCSVGIGSMKWRMCPQQ
mmetsp:Transcript_3060/g.9532  ORF Transcript_3060/g.9532 Transcript_3060/m.9532 type:complete len:224 (-) Transcript_3060:643-1314(-)